MSVCFILLAFSLLWSSICYAFGDQYWFFLIGSICGGMTLSFFVNNKRSVYIVMILFATWYLFTIIYYPIYVFTEHPNDASWYIVLPLHPCDIVKLFVIFWVIAYPLKLKYPQFMGDYILCFTFLGSIAYSVAGLHWGEALSKPIVMMYCGVHNSYYALFCFIFFKRIFTSNRKVAILNAIWIAILYVPAIFFNQIYNYYILFTWRMENNPIEGDSPLTPIYLMFKNWGWTFDVGRFEFNIAFYILVLGICVGVLYLVTWIFEKVEKKLDELSIVPFIWANNQKKFSKHPGHSTYVRIGSTIKH
ncbi:MAG: hypothetical protein LBV22_03655 [Mycoplasmataceae bacterium]|nr:hypothetical protein [Mycoplasmataceae bacterium]